MHEHVHEACMYSRSFRSAHSKEEERAMDGKARKRESYMKITYSVGPALKRPRTYNRGQLKSLVHVNARFVIFRNPEPSQVVSRPFLFNCESRTKIVPVPVPCLCGNLDRARITPHIESLFQISKEREGRGGKVKSAPLVGNLFPLDLLCLLRES